MEETVQDSNDNKQESKTLSATNPRTLDEFACSLYISRIDGPQSQVKGFQGGEIIRSSLEDAIRSIEPCGDWYISETSCGLIAAFARDCDAERLLQRADLARVFAGPIQVARFSSRDTRYRQSVLLRDVPWAIPLEDLSSALAKQGIAIGTVERSRQYVRVEVLDAGHYELLLRDGLNFFGAARFSAIPERWWRAANGVPSSVAANAADHHTIGGVDVNNNANNNNQQSDGVLQCYRCQGFWHVAANCRHLPRCVRCGEPHSVEFCRRPRNNPICCHCSGPHHAGFRQCPVRLQLLNATPISITLSATRIGGQGGANGNGAVAGNSIGKPSVSSATGQSTLKPDHS